MLKILIVGSLPRDLVEIKGGVEAVIFNMLEGYSEFDNIKVKIFSLAHKTKKAEEVWVSKNVSIEYYPYGFTKSTKLGALLNGCKFLNKIIKEYNPDIIHFQGNGSLLLLSLWLNSKSLVITPHGMLKEEFKHAQGPIAKLNFIMAIGIESLLIKRFHNFIFIAEYAKSYFFKNYKYLKYPPYKFEIIPNPLAQFYFEKPLYPEKINNLIFIGSIIPRKGLGLLLSAITKVKTAGYSVKLSVVGDFNDDIYRKKIFLQINNLDISGIVNFYGWQKKDRVYELLKSSDCLVLPSYQETLPVSILEAMAMGKIVVSSDVGGCPEIIQNNFNGFLFKKGNIADLVTVLLNIMTNKNLTYIAKNAHSTAIESYQSKKVTEKVLAFYQSLVND